VAVALLFDAIRDRGADLVVAELLLPGGRAEITHGHLLALLGLGFAIVAVARGAFGLPGALGLLVLRVCQRRGRKQRGDDESQSDAFHTFTPSCADTAACRWSRCHALSRRSNRLHGCATVLRSG